MPTFQAMAGKRLRGVRIVFGPVAGAFFTITLENYLTKFGQWVFVVQGSSFVICVLLFRRGIVGELRACCASVCKIPA